MSSSIADLIEVWNEAVRRYLDGRPSDLPEPLDRWFRTYSGTGKGAVDLRGTPEPYLGSLRTSPAAVILGLNPGQAFPRFQGPDGIFAEEIRSLGSHSAWAETWAYFRHPWIGQLRTPTFHTSRLRFMRQWLKDASLTATEMVLFELFPWHSTKLTASLRPDPGIMRELIWEPVQELEPRWVFAFGAPWFDVITKQLGLEVVARLGRGGEEYGSDSSTRSAVLARSSSGALVLAEKHQGCAGPPSEPETRILRNAVERRL